MKKALVLLLSCLAIAFTSCKPDPTPEPDPTPDPTPANAVFIGNYSGSIFLNGNATSPDLTALNLPGYPIDSLEFLLSAQVTAGDTDESVNVVFTISDENYTTKGSVNGNEINFGTLSYTYVEGSSSFLVNLDLVGDLGQAKDELILSGPFNGTGTVTATFQGIPVTLNNLNATGNVSGKLAKE